MDFIQSDRFIPLADNKKIFYCKIDHINAFFRKALSEPFILISHAGDIGIANNHVGLLPNNLIRWFGQNVEVVHPKIESLPIGLENNTEFPEMKKRDKIIGKMNEERRFKNLLYVNHDISTNPFERLEPYLLFKDKIWCTCVLGANGKNFDEYVDNIYNHKFVLSPRGNGIDTYRLWECLYMGTIPVEKRNLNNRFYTDLPICFVDNWSDINEDFLNKEYTRIKSAKWNLNKLNFEYWKEKILNFV